MNPSQTILILDDDENDVFFFKRALSEISAPCRTHTLKNGQEAIDYLSGFGDYADRSRYPMPRIILMDLKMPIMDGFQFLQWLRRQPGLNVIPAVIISSSDLAKDVTRAYECGANAFMTKPVNYDCLVTKLQTFSQYWLHCCRHPEVRDPSQR